MNRHLSHAPLLALILLAACSEPPPPAASAAAVAPLASLTVSAGEVPREMLFDGTVEAVKQSTVAAQTSGRVVELPYDVGDFVEKDAVIVRITPTEQRARKGAAEAGLSGARSRLAEAQLAFNRTKDVYDQKLIAKSQFDAAATNLAAAQAAVRAAEAGLTEAGEGLGYTAIRAPYAGIVLSRLVQIGETVTPGKPLMTGVSLDQLRVVVDIPQQHIAPLRKHGKARLLLADGRSLEASELRIPPSADTATHSFRVLLSLPAETSAPELAVAPGTLVKVAFVSGSATRLMLPATALVQRGELTAAYVLGEQGRIELRYLRLGTPAADGRLPVLAGLAPGEKLALDPVAAGIAYRQQGLPTVTEAAK